MNDIKDVKPPLNLPDFWWLWLLLAILIAIAVAYAFWRLRKPGPPVSAPAVLPVPPWETAYQQLDDLQRRDLLSQGLFKEFFTTVADIARHYMENRFNLRAAHMSTEEFLYSLRNSIHLNEEQKEALKGFLNSCDMVKFAKYAPTPQEAQANFDSAKKLIDDTRP